MQRPYQQGLLKLPHQQLSMKVWLETKNHKLLLQYLSNKHHHHSGIKFWITCNCHIITWHFSWKMKQRVMKTRMQKHDVAKTVVVEWQQYIISPMVNVSSQTVFWQYELFKTEKIYCQNWKISLHAFVWSCWSDVNRLVLVIKIHRARKSVIRWGRFLL